MKKEKEIGVHQLIVILNLANDIVHKIIRKEFRKFGLTPEQGSTLVGIYVLGDNTTAASLARYSFKEPATISVTLNRLEKLGLIERNADSARKNISRVSLTKKGREFYFKVLKIPSVRNVMGKMTPNERKQLWILLNNLKNLGMAKLGLDGKAYAEFFEKLSQLQ
jgi:DNA-binding MarR family transcriptional regulator